MSDSRRAIKATAAGLVAGTHRAFALSPDELAVTDADGRIVGWYVWEPGHAPDPGEPEA